MPDKPPKRTALCCAPSNAHFGRPIGHREHCGPTASRPSCWRRSVQNKTFPELTRDEISEFVTDQLARHRPTSAAVRFRALRRFYNWLVDEEIMTASPMARMIEPAVPEQPVPILSDAELAALLKATTGKEFEQRRDHAMIRLFLDCGIRVGERWHMSEAF